MACACVLQVHFEGGTVAQIVYSGDQADRGQQQVVYTADGNSYTSVESAEHTLVYIHPADGTQVRRDLTEMYQMYKLYMNEFICRIHNIRFALRDLLIQSYLTFLSDCIC